MRKGNDWTFDLEETANLANIGLAVLTNGKRKLYLKPIRLTKEQKIAYKKFGIDPTVDYEFEPLQLTN
jgi:hypothetical protein